MRARVLVRALHGCCMDADLRIGGCKVLLNIGIRIHMNTGAACIVHAYTQMYIHTHVLVWTLYYYYYYY